MTLHPVRMVQPVLMNMVATHVSVLNSGLVTTVQVFIVYKVCDYLFNTSRKINRKVGHYACLQIHPAY